MTFVMARKVSRAAFLTIAALILTGGLTYAYLTDSAIYAPANYYNFLPPAAGGSYLDPSFGTTVTRISDARHTASSLGGTLGMITNEYSTMSPFNRDNTRLVIQHDSYFGLYDGTGHFLKDLPFVINASAEPRWSKTNADILYFVKKNQLLQYDVVSGAQSVVRTFSEYSAITGRGESDISEDGSRFAFLGDSRQVFLYDLFSGTKGPVLETGGQSIDGL